ncbi:MAG: 50S ribosomal protein L17 [Verrucomicrobia bacterium]|nr:MAG: 50S ribosomal protein L17 [Verrucomicrobiota bacterium]
MRHRKKTIKLGRTSEHRDALLASLATNLIKRGRIQTTISKAKAVRPFAEKLVTLAKRGDLAARRVVASRLKVVGPGVERSSDKEALEQWHKEHDVLRKLFAEIAPVFKDRQGGYTRIMRLAKRGGDGAEEALIEWVSYVPQAPKAKPEDKGKAKAAGKKTEKAATK